MKKIIATILVLLLLSVIFASCESAVVDGPAS